MREYYCTRTKHEIGECSMNEKLVCKIVELVFCIYVKLCFDKGTSSHFFLSK